MTNVVKTIATLITGLAALAAPTAAEPATIEAPALVQLQAGSFEYWAAGEFTRDGKPVDAPHATVRIPAPLSIMTHQVTAGEYRRCMADKACAPLADEHVGNDLPVVMVSWRDAQDYAAWLSKKTGDHYRLPTDEEWTYAAASRAPHEVALGDADAVARWLAQYNRETQAQPVDGRPQPVGHFGANENGLLDLAGNVWEWTDSCYTRAMLDADGKSVGPQTVNCGVRIAEGRHRAYVSDFIRDPRGGGCAAGVPPSNLGFRLVRESRRAWSLF